MRTLIDFVRNGNIATITLIAGGVLAFVSIFASQLIGVNPGDGVADLYLESEHESVVQDETVTITIMARSSVPVNVFAGELRFDPELFSVDAISYNTGIADLWVELPWYSNGAGTLNFGGGTTKPGGFIGTGDLITVTFIAKSPGNALLSLHDPRILLHNGLGTDAELGTPLDTIIHVDSEAEVNSVPLGSGLKTKPIAVVSTLPSPDLDGDGVQTIADISMFMVYISRQDMRADFDGSGTVDTKDLSRLLRAP